LRPPPSPGPCLLAKLRATLATQAARSAVQRSLVLACAQKQACERAVEPAVKHLGSATSPRTVSSTRPAIAKCPLPLAKSTAPLPSNVARMFSVSIASSAVSLSMGPPSLHVAMRQFGLSTGNAFTSAPRATSAAIMVLVGVRSSLSACTCGLIQGRGMLVR
jgi:hypothetical protein